MRGAVENKKGGKDYREKWCNNHPEPAGEEIGLCCLIVLRWEHLVKIWGGKNAQSKWNKNTHGHDKTKSIKICKHIDNKKLIDLNYVPALLSLNEYHSSHSYPIKPPFVPTFTVSSPITHCILLFEESIKNIDWYVYKISFHNDFVDNFVNTLFCLKETNIFNSWHHFE